MTTPDDDRHTLTGTPWYVDTDATTDATVEHCRASYARALDFWGTRLVTQHGALRYTDVRVWDREPNSRETEQHHAARVVEGSVVTYWRSGTMPDPDELSGP